MLAGLGDQLGFLSGVAALEINSEVVFFVLLPTLIFQSAFHLDARALRENLAPTLTLAVPGLLISTFVIGGQVIAASIWITACIRIIGTGIGVRFRDVSLIIRSAVIRIVWPWRWRLAVNWSIIRPIGRRSCWPVGRFIGWRIGWSVG